MNVLPPGTILQLMYLRERLALIAPGHFIEIGPGSGEITNLLLELGWTGCSYDLEPRTVEQLKIRFSRAISEGRYEANNQDFLRAVANLRDSADLIISCMVMEHFSDELEAQFMSLSLLALKDNGCMIGLVPSSPAHWGIEDDIAGHCRRYSRDRLYALAAANKWGIRHLRGLTYPVSNILLPVSDFLVRRNESGRLGISNLEKTKASGIRNVRFKTHFPPMLWFLLNRWVLLPLYWVQKAFGESERSLVLYFEASPLEGKRKMT